MNLKIDIEKIEYYIEQAIKFAKIQSNDNSCIPVGCIITNNDNIISIAANDPLNPILHAEIIAINQVIEKYNKSILLNCILYSTLEPCDMCMNAIKIIKIPYVFFGAYDIYKKEKIKIQKYGGFKEKESIDILQKYFQIRRNKDT